MAAGRPMHRCAIADDPCGLRLARPIRNAAGTVLLERGVVLEPRMLGTLRQLGVKFVFVEQLPAGGAMSAAEAAARQAIAEREAKRFGDVGDDPHRAALLAAAIELKASEWEGSAGRPGQAPGATR